MDIDLTEFADSKCTQKIKLIFRGTTIAEIAIHPEKLSDTSVIGYRSLIQEEEVWINDILNNNLVKDGCVKLV